MSLTPRRHCRWRGGTLLSLLGAACLSGCVFVHADLNLFRARAERLVEFTVAGKGREKILLIEVSRLISNVQPRSWLGIELRPTLLARIKEELERAEQDQRVRAVVVRINSPGGTVGASDTLYRELREFRTRTGRPIVAYIGEVGTSGAYYVALAADEIWVSPTAVTGSVGVIWTSVNVAGLLEKLGIQNQSLKSGELKDAGSPLKPMNDRERTLLLQVLQAMHERFLATLRERRPQMSEEALERVRDGRILYAQDAVELGLADEIGYLDDAIARARELAAVPEARVVMYRRSSQYAENIYSSSDLMLPGTPVWPLDIWSWPIVGEFYYLWAPGAHLGEGAIGFP